MEAVLSNCRNVLDRILYSSYVKYVLLNRKQLNALKMAFYSDTSVAEIAATCKKIRNECQGMVTWPFQSDMEATNGTTICGMFAHLAIKSTLLLNPLKEH